MEKIKVGDLVFYKESSRVGPLYDNKIRKTKGQNVIPYLDDLCCIIEMNDEDFMLEDGNGMKTKFTNSNLKHLRLAAEFEIKEYQLKELFTQKPRGRKKK